METFEWQNGLHGAVAHGRIETFLRLSYRLKFLKLPKPVEQIVSCEKYFLPLHSLQKYNKLTLLKYPTFCQGYG